MPDTKIVIEPLNAEELAAQEKGLSINQQLYQALRSLNIGEGFAMPVPENEDPKKLINAFKPFIAKKDVKGTVTAHKSDKTRLIVKRVA